MSTRVDTEGFVHSTRGMKRTATGHDVLAFTVKSGFKPKKDGEWKNQFFSVELWNSDAHAAGQINEGDRVHVEGELIEEEYEKDGVKRVSKKIRFAKVLPLRAKKTDGAIAGRMGAKREAPARTVSDDAQCFGAEDETYAADDDSLPF